MNEMGIQLVTNHSIFMAKAMSQFWLGHGCFYSIFHLKKKPFLILSKDLRRIGQKTRQVATMPEQASSLHSLSPFQL